MALEHVHKQVLLGKLYFRMLCLHINVFGLVFALYYTQQLVLCSEF